MQHNLDGDDYVANQHGGGDTIFFFQILRRLSFIPDIVLSPAPEFKFRHQDSRPVIELTATHFLGNFKKIKIGEIGKCFLHDT